MFTRAMYLFYIEDIVTGDRRELLSRRQTTRAGFFYVAVALNVIVPGTQGAKARPKCLIHKPGISTDGVQAVTRGNW